MNLVKDKIYLHELEGTFPDTTEIRDVDIRIGKTTAALEALKGRKKGLVKKGRDQCQHEIKPLYLKLLGEEKEIGIGCQKCGYYKFFTDEEMKARYPSDKHSSS